MKAHNVKNYRRRVAIIVSDGKKRRDLMDWMTGLQRAIDYVEAHLTDDIGYAAVAKEAASSSFHFQRVFSIICGYTLGDYIRMRRLSLAADELMRTNEKVIDIALKYGYDTPESFSRAFYPFPRCDADTGPLRQRCEVVLPSVR